LCRLRLFRLSIKVSISFDWAKLSVWLIFAYFYYLNKKLNRNLIFSCPAFQWVVGTRHTQTAPHP
jgi:hypothetical protein